MTESMRCNSCQQSFDNLSMRNNHVKTVHQKSVRATYSNGTTKRIKRGINGTFTCICNDEFSLGNSLRRHAKRCQAETLASTDSNRRDEGREINVDISDLPFDCIGSSPFIVSERAELTVRSDDESLQEIDCFINQRLGLIICRQCQIAVPPEHLRSHLVTKHDLYYSAEELESMLQSYSVMSLNDTTEFIEYTDTLPEPIGGLPILEEGYKCLICPHHSSSWPTMRDHFSRSHREKKASADSEKCPVQLVFHGKLRKYMGVAYVKAKENALRNPSLADALVHEEEEEEMEVPTKKRHKSLRKCSTFVARSRWDILIEDEDVERLRKIAGLPQPKDPLRKLVKGTVEYFKRISESVRTGNVLARRWVMSMG